MKLIFNEKIVEKQGLWVPWIVHGTHWCALSTAYFACVNSALIETRVSIKKKKKRVKRDASIFICGSHEV